MSSSVRPGFDRTEASKLPTTVRAAFAPACSLEDAQRYTRTLALGHYENFSVISMLLPRGLRQDFSNVYAFCRTADDLGDEVGDREAACGYLERFKEQTYACFDGKALSPLFVALMGTVRRHEIPIEPFLDLIDAFQQDQRMDRYDTFDDLLDYCRRSADPVGRLVLYMCGYRDEQRQRLSDRTCTALQLANFWQDVRRDIVERGRIYIPGDSMRRFNVSAAQIVEGRFDDNFRRLMRFEVARTGRMFDQGEALLPMLRWSVRRHVSLFGKGGRAVLAAIRGQNYDTLTRRPKLSKWQKGKLVAGAVGARVVAGLFHRPME